MALRVWAICFAVALAAGCGKSESPTETPSPGAGTGPVSIQIQRAEFPRILIEAESGEIAAPVQVFKDDDKASGGAYVLAPEGPDHKEMSVGGGITLKFEAPESGNYILWLRGRWCCDCGNSLEVILDGVSLGVVEDAVLGTWHWVALRGETRELKPVSLRSGSHLLALLNREDGAAVDQILLTQDPEYRPTEIELPGAASTAESGPKPDDEALR